MSFPYSLFKTFSLKLVQEVSALKIQSAKLTGNGKKSAEANSVHYRAVGAEIHPDVGRSVDSISTRGQIMPTTVIQAPPDFQTLRRPCILKYKSRSLYFPSN